MPSIVLDNRTGVGIIILTVCFFKFLSKLCKFLPLPQSVFERNDKYRTFRWRNLVISWFHACIVGLWSLLCLLFYFDKMWEDMYLFINGPTFSLCCFTMGYFVYDTIDIVYHKRIREKWEILLHHSAIVFSAGYIIVSTRCVGYQVFAMLIELNTSFLHTRKLMQMAAVPRKHFLVQLNVYVNLITFLLFRFVPLGVLIYGIFKDGHRVPSWFLVQYTICTTVLLGINVILLYRLLKADVLGYLLLWLNNKGDFAIANGDEQKQQQRKPLVAVNGDGDNHYHHRKIDSTGGFCASLNIVGDEFPPPSSNGALSSDGHFDKSTVGNNKDISFGTKNVDLKLRSHVTKPSDGVKALA